MSEPMVDLIYSAFCPDGIPQVRKLARKHGFQIREYDIWNLDAGDQSLPPHVRQKIGLVRSGAEGFVSGACFIDGEEVDWWPGFEKAFASARENADG